MNLICTITPDKATISELDHDSWRKLAGRFKDYSYRQEWHYGIALANRRRSQSEHVAIQKNGEVIGIADVRVKRLPVVGGGIAYINGGPLCRQDMPGDLENLSATIEALRNEYVVRRRMVLRVVAPVGEKTWMQRASEVLVSHGGQPTSMSAAYRTILVDLAPDLPAIRARLASKWRNQLNSAERKGLALEVGGDQESIAAFCDLFRTFVARKKFDVDLGPDFYAELQSQLAEKEKLFVCLARLNDQIVAGYVGSLLGDTAVYLLGATNEEGMKSKAAYLIQWHAITVAKEKGLRWYDLGGIDPVSNPGVYHFKSGFGGVEVQAPGPFRFESGAATAKVTTLAERLYRKVGKWRRARGALS